MIKAPDPLRLPQVTKADPYLQSRCTKLVPVEGTNFHSQPCRPGTKLNGRVCVNERAESDLERDVRVELKLTYLYREPSMVWELELVYTVYMIRKYPL